MAAEHGGYLLSGVRGWAHLENVEEGVQLRLFEVLPRLHGMGLLDRMDVRVPGRKLPVWLYRVNDSGARFVAEMGGTSSQRLGPPVTPDSNAPAYLPQRQRGALLLLRQAHDDPNAPVRFGERGWVTGRELGVRKDAWNDEYGGPPYVAVDTTDLRWLAGWGLIERRDQPALMGQQRHVVYWRVKKFGRCLKLLDWREPQSEVAAKIQNGAKGEEAVEAPSYWSEQE